MLAHLPIRFHVLLNLQTFPLIAAAGLEAEDVQLPALVELPEHQAIPFSAIAHRCGFGLTLIQLSNAPVFAPEAVPYPGEPFAKPALALDGFGFAPLLQHFLERLALGSLTLYKCLTALLEVGCQLLLGAVDLALERIKPGQHHVSHLFLHVGNAGEVTFIAQALSHLPGLDPGPFGNGVNLALIIHRDKAAPVTAGDPVSPFSRA